MDLLALGIQLSDMKLAYTNGMLNKVVKALIENKLNLSNLDTHEDFYKNQMKMNDYDAFKLRVAMSMYIGTYGTPSGDLLFCGNNFNKNSI